MITKRKRLGRPSLSGLLATRHGALALALSCALVAVGIMLFAMSQYRHSVSTSAKQSTVLVSTAEIQKGASASAIAAQGLYKVLPVLQGQVSANAISDAGALVGKVAANTILPGQQLTAADFVTASGVAPQLTSTERAISLTLDPAHGLGSAIQSGDQVDIYGSFSAGGGGTANVISLVVPDATVLKATSGSGSADDVLLGVSDELVPKLLWVADYGKVWLVLRAAGASNPAPTVTDAAGVLAGNHSTLSAKGASATLTFTSPSSSGSHR